MSSPSRFAPLFGLGSRGAAAAAAQTTAPSTNTAASSPAKPHAPVVVVSTSSGTAATDAPATVNTTAVVAATSTATAEGSGSGSGSVGGAGGGGGGGEGGGPGAEDWERPERAKEAWRDVKWLQHVALESLRPSHLLRLTPEQLYTFLPILANLVTKAPTSKAPGSQVPTRSEWETAISSAVWGNRQVVSLSMFAFWLNRAGILPEAAMTPPSVV
ncbi:hypothetical protein Pelo_1535 [Pelomyxa schiedti]|nr:hypothetical protein Pelo_1535 [Pelomyxa schiedti]